MIMMIYGGSAIKRQIAGRSQFLLVLSSLKFQNKHKPNLIFNYFFSSSFCCDNVTFFESKKLTEIRLNKNGR